MSLRVRCALGVRCALSLPRNRGNDISTNLRGAVYEDEKELRSRIKTRIPMSEIMNADIPKSKQMQATHEFIVRSTKREYHFRTASREHRDAWVCVINTVSPTGSPKTQRRALSRTRAPSQTPSRRPGSGAG